MEKRTTRTRGCPIVEVEWWDAATDSRWKDGYDVDPGHCAATGYLATQTKKKLVLVTTFGESGQTCARFVIPKDWVSKMRRVGTSRWVEWRGGRPRKRE